MNKPGSAAFSFACALALIGAAIAQPQTAATKPAPVGAAGDIVAMRRLTEGEYRRSIADIFGQDVKVQGRFEPEVRRDGLIAIGSAQAAVSSSGMEQYYATASGIAAQLVSRDGRKKHLPCEPAAAAKADDGCARQIFTKYGRLLYRRPLTDAELKTLVATAHSAATQAKDFHVGIEETFISMLTSPHFLFRIERSAGPAGEGGYRLDDYSRASRLSFLLWDAPPDDELLAAAGRGELATTEGLQRQVDRLSASPRMKEGVAAFFDDMLQLDLFRTQTKDAARFPKYSQVLAEEAREQTIRTIVSLTVEKNGDYRDIFTTRDTFMTRTLAMAYKVPYTSRAAWAPYSFSADSGRSGILTHLSFLSLFAHPAVSSPTRRGVAINEIFFCQPVPPPPPDVDFSAVNEGANRPKTVRARLELHRSNKACATCHALFDPLGVPLEKFDALGQSRTAEAGEPIDATSEYLGVKFDGAPGLGALMHDSPRATSCLVRNLYATAVGRAPGASDRAVLDRFNKTFADDGYRIPALIKAIAMSEAFHSSPAAPAAQSSPTQRKTGP